MREVVLSAHYFVNFDFIVENHCINKNDETLKCNGKCYLKKQLNVQDNEPQQTIPKVDLSNKVHHICEEIGMIYPYSTENKVQKSLIYYHRPFVCSNWVLNLLRPPIEVHSLT